MPEYSLHELEAMRLQREMAAIDINIGEYHRNLATEIAATVRKDADRREKCQKAGKAGWEGKMSRNMKLFNGATRGNAAY